MPCRWHGKDIVVLDSVIISEPYAVENVKGNEPNAAKRVKTVVCGRTFRWSGAVLTGCAARGREAEASECKEDGYPGYRGAEGWLNNLEMHVNMGLWYGDMETKWWVCKMEFGGSLWIAFGGCGSLTASRQPSPDREYTLQMHDIRGCMTFFISFPVQNCLLLVVVLRTQMSVKGPRLGNASDEAWRGSRDVVRLTDRLSFAPHLNCASSIRNTTSPPPPHPTITSHNSVIPCSYVL